MIAAMSRFELTALSSERAQLLRALQRTQLVELTFSDEEAPAPAQDAELSARLARVERCIGFLTAQADAAPDKKAIKGELSGEILLGFDEFFAVEEREEALLRTVSDAEACAERLAQNRAERNKLTSQKNQVLPYLAVPEPFSAFADTRTTQCFFGLLDEGALPALETYAAQSSLVAFTAYDGGKQRPVAVFCHDSAAEETADKLSELAFARCTLPLSCTAAEEIARLEEETERLEREEGTLAKGALSWLSSLKDLKIYADYLSSELEKAEDFSRFFRTEKTFTAGGYVPAEAQERVRAALSEVTDAFLLTFSEPTEEDTPPTLMKNRGPARAAEFVTNMYSAPDYREFDPNGFVFFFFMIFFGLIMADIGYGILLFVGGLVLTKLRKVNDGMKKLTCILAYGGLFTIAFGALFGSLFGFSLYHFLPDPTSGSRTDVLTILLGCLALGLFQITVGYLLSAVNSIRRGNVLDAVCDALTWVLFCIGLFFAVFNFLTEYFGIPVAAGVKAFFSAMTLPGVVMLGVGLAGAALTAGRKEKLLGKFTKGFGAVYGIINLLSDVLSYARLFGLMLSGMIIAQQFNAIGLDLISAGAVGYVFGPVVMLIGHAFNLAMGVLGAYIHDCRLQYIEFFSKFYTGEGALFTPLGSRRQYVYFTEAA